MTFQFAKISGSCTVSGPGIYEVTTVGVTVTLPTWTQWPELGPITIKDQTGSANPNIAVKPPSGGTIDGSTNSVSMLNENESLTFEPTINGNSWAII